MNEPQQLILLVEDNPDDGAATARTLRAARLCNPIRTFTDGDEVLDYLFRRGRFLAPESSPRPALVLLDLNLPSFDGRSVLRLIREAPALDDIPVIVLTGSTDPDDLQECLAIGASGYMQKPLSLPGFVRSLGHLAHFSLGLLLTADDPPEPSPCIC